jgi:O-antigen ligase
MQPQMFKKKLLHPYWLITSLSAVVFFFFLPSRGALEYSTLLTGFLLFVHLVCRDYRISTFPKFFLVTLCAILILSSFFFSYGHTDTHRVSRIIKMLIIVFSVDCLGQANVHKQIRFVFGVCLPVLITGEFFVRTILGRPYGTYSNPHYLAELASLVLPFIFLYCWTAPKAYKVLFIALGIIDLDLLFRTSSRPAILALAMSILFVVVFLVHGRKRWLSLITIFLVAVGLYLTRYAHVVGRIDDLIVHLSSEERVQFWGDTWEMLRKNSLGAWIIGNGIGSFPNFFPTYSIPKYAFFSFPHNHMLQILFDNGVIGLTALLAWQVFLFCLLIQSSRRATESKLRLLINSITVVYLTWAIFTSLVFGFYSRFTLYPFAFITGIILILAEKQPESDTVRNLIPNEQGYPGSRCQQAASDQLLESGD